MDEKDVRILHAIADLGTGSPDRIAAATGIPKSTVHYRIKQLREVDGVVLNDLFDVDVEKLGLSITIISEVFANFEEGYHRRVGEQLAAIEGVNQVYFTMGDTDFIVIANLADRAHVEHLIEDYESITEINRTSSRFVISTVKNEPRPMNDFSLESLLDVLIGDAEV